MSEKLTLQGLETFKDEVVSHFSLKGHKHSNYLTTEQIDGKFASAEHVHNQYVKSVNGNSPDESGNVEVATTLTKVVTELPSADSADDDTLYIVESEDSDYEGSSSGGTSKSVYDYMVEKGYTGTEEEFATQFLALLAMQNLTNKEY